MDLVTVRKAVLNLLKVTSRNFSTYLKCIIKLHGNWEKLYNERDHKQ